MTEYLSSLAIPAVIFIVALLMLFSKKNYFEYFIEGAKEGLHSALSLLPTLVALMVAIGMLRASGASEILAGALSPITEKLGIPSELLPLLIIRPFSGSGSIALFEDVLSQHGPDSFPGRVASVILGSSETTFYTLSVYFAATKVKKTRYTLPSALCGDIMVCVMSGLAVKCML